MTQEPSSKQPNKSSEAEDMKSGAKSVPELIEHFECNEENVECSWIGPQRAFFEINGERYFYMLYVIGAELAEDALEGLKHSIEQEIKKALGAGKDGHEFPDERNQSVNIVWRLNEKIIVKHQPDGRWLATTRLALIPTRKLKIERYDSERR